MTTIFTAFSAILIASSREDADVITQPILSPIDFAVVIFDPMSRLLQYGEAAIQDGVYVEHLVNGISRCVVTMTGLCMMLMQQRAYVICCGGNS